MIAVYLLVHNTMISAICGAVAGLLQPYLFKNLKINDGVSAKTGPN